MTLQLGDVTSDGVLDICSRADGGFDCGVAVRDGGTCAAPATCADLRARNPAAGDGEHTLYVNGSASLPWTAYCHDMAGTPREYLTLASGATDRNFAQYTAGGASAGTSVRTSDTRVRVNPANMAVLITDQTFSNHLKTVARPPARRSRAPSGANMAA